MKQGKHTLHYLFNILVIITALAYQNTVHSATTMLYPTSLTSEQGSHSNQGLSVLQVMDQSGSENNWNAYIEFSTQQNGYSGTFTFELPTGVNANEVTDLTVETNYLGATIAEQQWQWQMHNYCSNTWVAWGDNSGAGNWSWTAFSFAAINSPSCYISSTNELELRYFSGSDVDNSDLDYLALSVNTAATATEVLLPLYNYPNWYDAANYIWDDVAAAGIDAQITAIINPNNGPNGCPNSDYVQGINELRNGSVNIVGYIYTSYGTRDINAVKADIDQYDNLCFDVDGIFFDEAANTPTQLAYYEALYAYVKSKPNLDTVVINPGTHTDEGYLSSPAADTVVIFEGDSAAWVNYQPASYVENYPAKRFSALIHAVPNSDTMRSHIDSAINRNIGYIYLTDDVMPNPWDTLATYWQEKIEYLALRNNVWRPAPGTSWQWQLNGTIDTSFDVQMYNVDLFDTPQSVIDQLHTDGRVVICYFSAGSREDWRDDANQFPGSVLGSPLGGWPGEKWLDIRQINIIGPIMQARLDLAVQKGCDGVEPDNVDGYTNSSGFPLSYQDQLTYNIWLADEAHNRELSVGLKNDLDQVGDLIDHFDWVLNEQCFQYNECALLMPFIDAGKAVFGVEYVEETSNANDFCPQANANNFDWLHKNMDLDAWRFSCR